MDSERAEKVQQQLFAEALQEAKKGKYDRGFLVGKEEGLWQKRRRERREDKENRRSGDRRVRNWWTGERLGTTVV